MQSGRKPPEKIWNLWTKTTALLPCTDHPMWIIWAFYAASVRPLSGYQNKLPLFFRFHPRTAKNLREFGLYDRLNDALGVILTDPFGYKAFMNLIFGCKFVITDSGGIQEETTYLKISCLTLRSNTERQVTITEGTNKLTTPERIEADLEEVIKKDSKEPPLFWDGKTSARVVKAIKTIFTGNLI